MLTETLSLCRPTCSAACPGAGLDGRLDLTFTVDRSHAAQAGCAYTERDRRASRRGTKTERRALQQGQSVTRVSDSHRRRTPLTRRQPFAAFHSHQATCTRYRERLLRAFEPPRSSKTSRESATTDREAAVGRDGRLFERQAWSADCAQHVPELGRRLLTTVRRRRPRRVGGKGVSLSVLLEKAHPEW